MPFKSNAQAQELNNFFKPFMNPSNEFSPNNYKPISEKHFVLNP